MTVVMVFFGGLVVGALGAAGLWVCSRQILPRPPGVPGTAREHRRADRARRLTIHRITITKQSAQRIPVIREGEP